MALSLSDHPPTTRREPIPAHPIATPLVTNQPTTRPVALPTIHLNGTGAAALQQEYRTLVNAVAGAESALQAATCNGRDFYPQGAGAWAQAQADRREMFRLLGVVRAYAEAWEGRAAAALDLADRSL